MKFLVDLELEPEDGGEPFTQEQILEHLRTYVFALDVSTELSTVPNDPYHELEGSNYRTYLVASCKVEALDNETQCRRSCVVCGWHPQGDRPVPFSTRSAPEVLRQKTSHPFEPSEDHEFCAYCAGPEDLEAHHD